jgi:cyclopropane-fatty-acyl-phospholipid synthase
MWTAIPCCNQRLITSVTPLPSIHHLGRRDGPGWTNPWLRRYILPGGYAPALSEVLPSIEREGLWVTDIKVGYAAFLDLPWRLRIR